MTELERWADEYVESIKFNENRYKPRYLLNSIRQHEIKHRKKEDFIAGARLMREKISSRIESDDQLLFHVSKVLELITTAGEAEVKE